MTQDIGPLPRVLDTSDVAVFELAIITEGERQLGHNKVKPKIQRLEWTKEMTTSHLKQMARRTEVKKVARGLYVAVREVARELHIQREKPRVTMRASFQ